MWTRSLLKENAKIAFKRNYWTCIIVSVILMLVGGGSEGPSLNINFDAGSTNDISINFSGKEFILMSVVAMAAIIAMVVTVVFSAFLTNIIMVGGKRYFMENREHKTQIGQVFYGFQSGYYMNIVKTMFLRELYIFGWTLLFVIPGVIKSYAYKLVPYIMAENPGMSTDRALELSSEMMSGNKFEAFILELSFFGWDFLNACTFGILGVFYVNPYKHATFAEFYTAVKADAFNRGITNAIELPGVSYQEFHQGFYQETFTQEEQSTGYSEDIFEEE